MSLTFVANGLLTPGLNQTTTRPSVIYLWVVFCVVLERETHLWLWFLTTSKISLGGTFCRSVTVWSHAIFQMLIFAAGNLLLTEDLFRNQDLNLVRATVTVPKKSVHFTFQLLVLKWSLQCCTLPGSQVKFLQLFVEKIYIGVVLLQAKFPSGCWSAWNHTSQTLELISSPFSKVLF